MQIDKKYIILKIKNQGIFFNNNDSIDWKNTNFPPKENFSISNSRDIYWQVEMKSFENISEKLTIAIIDYDYRLINNDFINQSPKKTIKGLIFEEVSFSNLRKSFDYYKIDSFRRFEFNTDDELEEESESTLRIEFTQPISKVNFKTGYAETVKKVKGVSNNLVIKIYNENLIPEFDFIKPYFSKVFGKRTISIRGVIGDKNKPDSYKFRSKEISKINDDLINSIKRLEIKKKIASPKVIEIDKSLFTPEEFFDGFEAEKGNNIRKSDQELLAEILELKGIRNKKQLLYISGKIQSEKEKIHFTLTPEFGFLFYTEGEQMHHFIWELLNTNATYIWSGFKDVSRDVLMKTIQRKVNFIRDNGRMKYITDEKNEDIVFTKINHEHANSKLVDGFPRWRKKFDEKLV